MFEGTRCLLWTGPFNNNGYGFFGIKDRNVYAHRWLYERWVGPIPEGLDLHHRCENRLCVNPEHLEPLTHAEHMAQHAT